MAFKVILALAACVAYASASVGIAPVAYAAPLVKAVDSEYDPHPQYSYGYDVQDALTGDSKTHQETRDGDVVQGQYSLVESDGTRRIVDYTADPINGFNAVVRKEPLGGRLVAAAPVVAAPIHQAPIVAAGPAPIISEAPTVVDARLASPLARFAAPGPVAYSAGVASPLAYSAGVAAPLAYSAGVAAPLAYSSGVAAPLAYSAGVSAPLAYSARVGAPLAYSAGLASPLTYSNAIGGPLAYSHGVGAPLAYSNGIGAPLAYSAGVASPLAYSHGIGAPLAYSSPFARFSSPLPYSARFSPYTSVY